MPLTRGDVVVFDAVLIRTTVDLGCTRYLAPAAESASWLSTNCPSKRNNEFSRANGNQVARSAVSPIRMNHEGNEDGREADRRLG